MLYLALMTDFQALKNLINPKKEPTKDYFLDLLDGEKQLSYECAHVGAVMTMLRALYLAKLKTKINAAREEKEGLLKREGYNAEDYRDNPYHALSPDISSYNYYDCNKSYKPVCGTIIYRRLRKI